MKKYILLCFLLSIGSLTVFAQAKKSHPVYTLAGTVVDSISGDKMLGVTVVVLGDDKTKAPKGGITNAKGEFRIENLTIAQPKLRFTVVGYKTKILDSITVDGAVINVGTVRIQSSSLMMKSVEIKGQRPMIEYQADKQIINMEQVPGANGSVTDALKNSGAVDVDPSTNKISIRGKSGVNIMIDGKPMPMAEDMLTQMPASAIDQVEISTNPSAKDDPEGDAGIINFITKKGVSDNYSGSFTLFSNSRGMNYGATFLNYKHGAWNVYGSANIGLGRFKNDVDFDRTNYESALSRYQTSRGDGLRKGFMGNARVGVDYDYDAEDVFSLSSSLYKMKGNGHNSSQNAIYDSAGNFRSGYFLENYGELDNTSYSATATYKKKFDKKGNELTTDFFYTYLDYSTPSDITTSFSGIPVSQKQRSSSVTNNKTMIAKLDYIDPGMSIGKVNLGYNFTFRDRSSDYLFDDYFATTDTWQNDTNFSNRFRYVERIHAVYADFSNKIWVFDYKLGARAEKILSTGLVENTNQSFELDYSSFFPSLLLSYPLSERFQLAFNISRRIKRPQMEYINPFKRMNGPNDYTIGNPALEPTYTNQYELSFNPLVKMYYSTSTGRPVSISAVVDDTVFVSSMVNNASTKSYGTEIMLPLINDSKFPIKLPDWWVMANITYTWSHTEESSNYLTEAYSIKRNSWTLNANGVFKTFADINAIINFRYTPETRDSRTITNDKSYLSFTLAKEFMDKKLRVTFTVSDILKANVYETKTNANGYYMVNSFTNVNSQNIGVSITYKFNDFKLHQERSIDDGRDKTEGGMF
jgi:hypothetical protein